MNSPIDVEPDEDNADRELHDHSGREGSALDPAEAVSLVLNYVTAYQMMHRSAKVRRGQRVARARSGA